MQRPRKLGDIGRPPASTRPLRNVRLTVAYDGRRFKGFEVQPGLLTVRGVLEEAIGKATGEKVGIHAAGRTDAGVHALGQVVSFFSRSRLPAEKLRMAIADELPDDVAISDLSFEARSFHARHSAIARRYRYQIGTEKLPLLRNQVHWVRARLDIDAMRSAAAMLPGKRDFAAFADVEPGDDTTLDLYECEVAVEPPLVLVDLLADRFLWKMARRIAGGLIAIGRHQVAPAAMADALREPDGPAAKELRTYTAPPQGLILLRVLYTGDIKPQAAKLRPLSE
ncbi:MAG: tRNA pseudouridine(38-40) synthase TruA [Acidobacteriota bacterium]